jgi:G:T/U-mismatch repair DNA glycosylase
MSGPKGRSRKIRAYSTTTGESIYRNRYGEDRLQRRIALLKKQGTPLWGVDPKQKRPARKRRLITSTEAARSAVQNGLTIAVKI